MKIVKVPGSSSSVILASPRGFCAGVVRAVDIVKQALELHGSPVYVRKEIVHNVHVVKSLQEEGAIFVDSASEVPEGALVIFSAHGVSPAVRREAAERRLKVLDGTCPLVTKVHMEGLRYAQEGYSIILIGHRDHDEVAGTLGEAPDAMQLISSVEEAQSVKVKDSNKVAVITQTTLSLDDTREILETLRRRFPTLVTPAKDDICYATQNRQNAVKEMAKRVDLILVLGSRNSSNANRLCEVAREAGARAFLIDDPSEIQTEWLAGAKAVGVTAGASTPEELVQKTMDYLQSLGAHEIEELRVAEESVYFPLPRELRGAR